MTGTITMTGEEYDALTRELAQERALVRSWIEKAEATRAATEALLVLNQDQRAKWQAAEADAMEWAQKADELRAETERLQRENGALARTYALAEEKLRERTEALNEALAQNERFDKRYRDAEAEVERLKTALYQVSRSANYIDNLVQQTLDIPNCC